jgi:hypothetical protein
MQGKLSDRVEKAIFKSPELRHLWEQSIHEPIDEKALERALKEVMVWAKDNNDHEFVSLLNDLI